MKNMESVKCHCALVLIYHIKNQFLFMVWTSPENMQFKNRSLNLILIIYFEILFQHQSNTKIDSQFRLMIDNEYPIRILIPSYDSVHSFRDSILILDIQYFYQKQVFGVGLSITFQCSIRKLVSSFGLSVDISIISALLVYNPKFGPCFRFRH